MDISIIIPIYNTEPSLLLRCFQSIRLAPDIAWEVILVDDGSQPETAECCKLYAEQNEGFVYYRQENQGVSAARNAGIAQAKGRYLLFVDSDDELLPDAIQKIQLQQNSDIIFYDSLLTEGEYVRRIQPFAEEKSGALIKKDAVIAGLEGSINPPWGKLFRREFLQANQIVFERTMLWAEDAYFVLRAVFCAEFVDYVADTVYRYHHVLTTDSNRIRKFPYETAENVVRLYHFSKENLQEQSSNLGIAAAEQARLELHLARMLIKRLFNIMGVQSIHKIHCPQAKELVIKSAGEVYETFGDKLGFMPKLRCRMLKNDMHILIFLVAKLRAVYMRVRK